MFPHAADFPGVESFVGRTVLAGAAFAGANLLGATGVPADAEAASFSATTCADGSSSDTNNGLTCAGHFSF